MGSQGLIRRYSFKRLLRLIMLLSGRFLHEVLHEYKRWLGPPLANGENTSFTAFHVADVATGLRYAQQNIVMTVCNWNAFGAEEGIIERRKKEERDLDLVHSVGHIALKIIVLNIRVACCFCEQFWHLGREDDFRWCITQNALRVFLDN